MSDQETSKEFTWNNPALGTLRACDVAEIRDLLNQGLSDADVSLILLRRALAFRFIRRMLQAGGVQSTYDITMLDAPSNPMAPGPVGIQNDLPKEIVEEICFLHAAGVNRNRLARLFGLDQEIFNVILSGSMEAKCGLGDTPKPSGAPSPKPEPEVATPASTESTVSERQPRRKSPFLVEESEILASGGTYQPWK